MAAKICPKCGLPADTRTGVHNQWTDCLRAKDEQVRKLQTEIDRLRRTLDAIDALTCELAGIDARRAR